MEINLKTARSAAIECEILSKNHLISAFWVAESDAKKVDDERR